MTTARGFTAIELTIVIVLVGLLSALAAPRLLDRSALAERASADELRALLRSARQIAVAQEREVCVMVIGATVRAVHVSAGACDLATPVVGPGGRGPLQFDAPNGIAFTGNPQVRFNARGQLNPAVDRVMGIGTRLWRVDRFTGAVS